MNFHINERESLYSQLIRYEGLQVHQKRQAIALYLNLVTFMLSAHLTRLMNAVCRIYRCQGGITLFGWRSLACHVLQATSAREVRSHFWRHDNRAGISQCILNRLLNNNSLFPLTDDEPLGHSHE